MKKVLAVLFFVLVAAAGVAFAEVEGQPQSFPGLQYVNTGFVGTFYKEMDPAKEDYGEIYKVVKETEDTQYLDYFEDGNLTTKGE